ncbi:hypothetical protein EOI86_17180 [Hwanghaeella grinnelliae]|uniref:DUF4863 family protein n=1 Tax=Hwanghaeella grinnelliae TaxID=2500179 RepID=A0A437QJB6_9PROT|nr:hypothetical protein [Hwanghaeella grinnelliae]RVU34597.1 hypothetical protein EOI86_17180 [Hwanghaeella grinnelliae]
MSTTLESFAASCKTVLTEQPGKPGWEAVCGLVREALADKEFVSTYILSSTEKRKIAYEDPDLGFCVCIHTYDGAAKGAPHDHGPTWAIYGQAEGETEMTDWEMITPPSDGKPGKVRQTRSYVMKPGDAHLYEPGDIHAPLREHPTRLLRIEGANTDKIDRTPMEPA